MQNQIVALLMAIVCVYGNNQQIDQPVTGRTVTTPSCAIGALTCSFTGTDEINNNQARQTNISRASVDATGTLVRATYSYQGANVQNQLILPTSAAADVTFIGIYEWADNGDKIPTENEMSNPELISPANRNWQNGAYGGGGGAATYMPFSAGLNFANFSIACYIVKNFTFDVPPELLRVSGYGSICRVQATKSQAIAPGNRLALKLYMDTSLAGGSVDTSPSFFQWSILTTANTGSRFRVGETWISLARQAGGSPGGGADVKVGPFTAVSGTEQSVFIGLDAVGVNSLTYSVGFEPVNLAYNGATSTAVSLFVLFSIICVALIQ